MKIAILGPVMTSNYYGGVATFDEGLSEAFQQMGHEVLLLTVQQETVKNKAITIRQESYYKIIKTVNRYQPDFIIASLQYGLCFPFMHYGKKILFLHGFFNVQSYGVIKTMLSVFVTKIIARYSDVILTNSNFTSMINQRIWNIPSNGVAYLGLDESFSKNVLVSSANECRKKGQILFVGRLAISKSVDRILHALSHLEKQKIDYHFVVAGDGFEREMLKELSQKLHLNVSFLGKVSHDDIYRLYKESEVFISLGSSEPFGITYIESLLSGCKIVCPNTGGQVEFLRAYSDRVSFVNPLDTQDIAHGVKEMLFKNPASLDLEEVSVKFNYKQTGKKIISFYESIEA